MNGAIPLFMNWHACAIQRKHLGGKIRYYMLKILSMFLLCSLVPGSRETIKYFRNIDKNKVLEQELGTVLSSRVWLEDIAAPMHIML